MRVKLPGAESPGLERGGKLSTVPPLSAGATWRAWLSRAQNPENPWNALWAMMIGFFMIMVDSTIVAVANPTIMTELHIGYDAVVWVTSAYLLGYAVVLLVAGRLGDRFGSKNLYLIGLGVFTLASMWCGISGGAAMLIAARVVQGVGAGILTPQTLSTITQIFPPQRRGVAMSVWGATAGVASLVGPLAGGALVDGLGWQWIFFINVPIGIVGLVLAFKLVPVLPTQAHPFDLIGVGLSGMGIFLIVFGLQQGQSAHWEPWVWATIVAGAGFVSVFVYWQSVNTREPLIPLKMFADRDFGLSNAGVAVVSFAFTAMMLPLTFYAQAVCGLSPTRSALLLAPMAITSAALAPFVGILIDKYPPRPVLGFGFSMLAIGLTWLSFEMAPDTPIWRLVLPFSVMGVGSAFVWSPLTATATRNLPPHLAGAGSAVYNAIRQLGAVLGSAGMAAFMTWRIGAEMPPYASATGDGTGLELPAFVREPFSAAMSQSVLLPAFIALFGIVAAIFLVGSTPALARKSRAAAPVDHLADDDIDDDYDDYVEFILSREPDTGGPAAAQTRAAYEEDCDTDPRQVRVQNPRSAPADVWRRDPVASWRSLLAEPSEADPVGFAHNGSRIGDGRRVRPIIEVPPTAFEPAPQVDRRAPAQAADRLSSLRRQIAEREAPRRNRHYRPDPDEPGGGRHSSGR
jgi:EmrB/QacA subfamily drug resistance transporter